MEADSDGIFTQLLLKKVLLVKEEDEGCVRKPPVVQDGAKQPQCLIHTVLQASRAEHLQALKSIHLGGNLMEVV